MGAALSRSEALSCLSLEGRDLTRIRRKISALHGWFASHARKMPWRETKDPYAIWVSEAMLQQTQVKTVIPYYQRWLDTFPTVRSLAQADESQVLKLWEGLGYYRRARNLHRAMKVVAEQHDGVVPATYEAFRALPGVGDYTAAAVQSIAFGHDHAVVDGNVRRVLSRWIALGVDPTTTKAAKAVDWLAQALLPAGTASVHNQAMMELGALVCTARKPTCETCVMRRACAATKTDDVTAFPLKKARKKVPHVDMMVAVITHGPKVLLYQRPDGGLLAGLWDFPSERCEGKQNGAASAELARSVRDQYGIQVEVEQPLPPVKHAYTHFKVTLHPFYCRRTRGALRAAEGLEARWVDLKQIGELALPRTGQKIVASLRAKLSG